MQEELTMEEVNRLMAVQKMCRHKGKSYNIDKNNKLEIDFISFDKTDEFVFNFHQNTYILQRRSHQLRTGTIPLFRIDLGSSKMHINPDGGKIHGNHIHYYRDGSALKWAEPIPDGYFRDVNNIVLTIHDFLGKCNVADANNIIIGLQGVSSI